MTPTNEPTTAQVDAALEFYNKDIWVNIANSENHNNAVILRAEVLRLREVGHNREMGARQGAAEARECIARLGRDLGEKEARVSELETALFGPDFEMEKLRANLAALVAAILDESAHDASFVPTRLRILATAAKSGAQVSDADRSHVCELSADYTGKCFSCGKQVFTREPNEDKGKSQVPDFKPWRVFLCCPTASDFSAGVFCSVNDIDRANRVFMVQAPRETDDSELARDKSRLDWLDTLPSNSRHWDNIADSISSRKAIDAAMEGGK